MDSRSEIQRGGSILVILVALYLLPAEVFANPVRIYFRWFDYPIPSPNDPDSQYGKGRMDDAIIDVPDCFTIWDLDVIVSITHGSFYDLRITLQNPGGQNVILNPPLNPAFIIRDPNGRLTPVGGSLQLFFDEQADTLITQAQPPFEGPYRPIESLSLFYGGSTFGPWRLQIEDWGYGHIGTLESVELVFTIPEPSTAILLLLGSSLLRLQKRCGNLHSP